jgi:uncharacterized membrane protein YbhN (UPF0104 family)
VIVASPLVDGTSILNGARSAFQGLQVPVASSWPWLLALVGAAAGHYVMSALALRAAAGRGLPICLKEATRVQVAAAAANRVTPSGLGAAAVNARFLSQCGQTASRSVGSIGAMHLFGAIAKGGVLLLLVAAGALTGSGQQISLGDAPGRMVAHLPALSPPLVLGAGAALAVITGIAVCCRARAAALARRARTGVAQALEQVTSMRRRPRDLALLLLASGGTTLMMGLGLVLSVGAVQGLGSIAEVNAILVGYLVGTAVGSAVPTPSGIGSTEAALVGVLVATGLAAGPALSAVLLFRAVTFWAPVPFGVLMARGLRRRRAL